MRLAAWALCCSTLLGCHAAEPAPPPAPAPARAEARAPSRDRSALAATLRGWLTRHDETPKRLAEQRCPDDALRASAETEREIALRVEDARFEKKTLLPLRLTNELVSVDAAALETATLPDSTRKETELDETLVKRVEWLASRRYLGVFHVTDYGAPKWIHRIDRLKPEWVPGYLVAWLVIHDAKTGEPACSTLVHVKNDVGGAPIAARERSETSDRLTRALGAALRGEAPRALARMSAVLHLGGGPAPRAALATR